MLFLRYFLGRCCWLLLGITLQTSSVYAERIFGGFAADEFGWAGQVNINGGTTSYLDKLAPDQRIKMSYPPSLVVSLAPYGYWEFAGGSHQLAAQYSYRHDWLTNEDLLKDYSSHSYSWAHQPYPLGMLQRTHTFLLAWGQSLSPWWQVGVHSRYAEQYIGSKWSRKSDPRAFHHRQSLYQHLQLVPWISYTWRPELRSIVALDCTLRDLDLFPDLSYATVDWLEGGLRTSGLMVHEWGSHGRSPTVSVKLSQYYFLARDELESYRRRSLTLAGSYPLASNVVVNLETQHYVDRSLVEPLGANQDELDASRYNTGSKQVLGVSFSQSAAVALEFSAYLRQNARPAKNIRDFEGGGVMIGVSWHEPKEVRELVHPRWLDAETMLKRIDLPTSSFPP